MIVLSVCGDQLLMAPPTFRPGIAGQTVDFPGGRVPSGAPPQELVGALLRRELGVAPASVQEVTPLNINGWAVDSSFSNQRIWGFIAQLTQPLAQLDEKPLIRVPLTGRHIADLLETLHCLQCRALLLERLHTYKHRLPG